MQVVHFIADLTDGCSAIAACCLTPRCSVSPSRKFRAGIVPDARLFLLQSALLCRECGTFVQGIIYLVLYSHLILNEVSVLMKIYVAS